MSNANREAYLKWRQGMEIYVSGSTVITPEFIWDAAWQAAQAQAVNQQLPEGYVRVPKETLTNMALDMRDVRGKVAFEDAPDHEARLLYAGWVGIIAVSQALDELLAEQEQGK